MSNIWNHQRGLILLAPAVVQLCHWFFFLLLFYIIFKKRKTSGCHERLVLLRVSSLLPAGSLDLWVPLFVPSRRFAGLCIMHLQTDTPEFKWCWECEGSLAAQTRSLQERTNEACGSQVHLGFAAHQHCLSVIFDGFVSFSFVAWWDRWVWTLQQLEMARGVVFSNVCFLWENPDLGCSWWNDQQQCVDTHHGWGCSAAAMSRWTLPSLHVPQVSVAPESGAMQKTRIWPKPSKSLSSNVHPPWITRIKCSF